MGALGRRRSPLAAQTLRRASTATRKLQSRKADTKYYWCNVWQKTYCMSLRTNIRIIKNTSGHCITCAHSWISFEHRHNAPQPPSKQRAATEARPQTWHCRMWLSNGAFRGLKHHRLGSKISISSMQSNTNEHEYASIHRLHRELYGYMCRWGRQCKQETYLHGMCLGKNWLTAFICTYNLIILFVTKDKNTRHMQRGLGNSIDISSWPCRQPPHHILHTKWSTTIWLAPSPPPKPLTT